MSLQQYQASVNHMLCTNLIALVINQRISARYTDRILFIRTHEHTLSNIGAFLLLSGWDGNPSQDETTHKVLFL